MEFASDADREYANGAFIPGAETYPAKWAERAQLLRDVHGPHARLNVPYGAGERQRLDLFLPPPGYPGPRGLLVFLHGGYWMAFGRETWSLLARGALLSGWACAIPSYTLAPAARIGEITREAAAAVRTASAMVAGPVVVTGHSAGGHLAARMGCADIGLPRVVRVVPISPLADLGPLMTTAMNTTLRIDEAEAVSESPARLALRAGVEAHVWVGGQERPAFLWQARTLSERWTCPWTVAPGRHHFDVIDELADPESALLGACLDGL